MESLKEAFGVRLKTLRKERKITQEDLAEILGINVRQLGRIEAGENFPSSDTLAKISVAFDVSLMYLFDFRWSHELSILTGGKKDLPLVRLLEKENALISLMAKKGKDRKPVDTGYKIDVNNPEKVMISVAQRLEKAITVEVFRDKKRKYIKTYYPDGRSEMKITNLKISSKTIQNFVDKKMKEYEDDIPKLEFIRLAVKSIEDEEALKELRTFLKGVEFSQSKRKKRIKQ